MALAHLSTPLTEQLGHTPWQSYPRPTLRRNSFINLNGWWDLALSGDDRIPTTYDRLIRVPFPPQSLLSGICEQVPESEFLWYRRTFPRPAQQGTGRVLLHFGGADQYARVWLNGTLIGEHEGGYQPFAFDITDLLQEENTLLVQVWDTMSKHILPCGKQSEKRGGMWYTPVSGLWQTVWLEYVPSRYIHRVQTRTEGARVMIRTQGDVSDGLVRITTPQGVLEVPLNGGQASFELEQPCWWSPERPYLYSFTVEAGEDRVESYFALRTLSVEQVGGYPRLCLNGKPYFFHGVLDQGYWCDGIFLPADPKGYEEDILAMKALGFNMLRKHVKVEPELFYYHCDRMGMVVFQDMVSNSRYSFLRDTALPTVGFQRKPDRFTHRDKLTREAFLQAMDQTVDRLSQHPCICLWTIFNEGWGQFESTKAYRRMKAADPTRFVAAVSGWFRGGESDLDCRHVYFRPFRAPRTRRPLVLSEFGGYSCPVDGHRFNPDKEYGYRHFDCVQDFEQALLELYNTQILPGAAKGLCASVLTQLSDVEDETNGLVTYDRRVCKLSDGPAFRALAQQLQQAVEGR